MYSVVPQTKFNFYGYIVSMAQPKSQSFTVPSSVKRTFSGFKLLFNEVITFISRCMMLRECKYSTADNKS
jgi:hypothetical protein